METVLGTEDGRKPAIGFLQENRDDMGIIGCHTGSMAK
jgi:hypothetical protein